VLLNKPEWFNEDRNFEDAVKRVMAAKENVVNVKTPTRIQLLDKAGRLELAAKLVEFATSKEEDAEKAAEKAAASAALRKLVFEDRSPDLRAPDWVKQVRSAGVSRKVLSLYCDCAPRKLVAKAILDGRPPSEVLSECYTHKELSEMEEEEAGEVEPGEAEKAGLGGMLYAVGGRKDKSPLDCVERYDDATKKCTEVSSLGSKRYGAGVAVMEGMLYVLGGRDDSGKYMDSVERYDQHACKWTDMKEMSCSRSKACVAVVNGVLYALGGLDNANNVLSSVEKYDQVNNKWTAVKEIGTKRYGAGAAVVEGLLYVVGGRDGSNYLDSNPLDSSYLNSVERYDQDADSWTEVAPMTYRRYGAGVAVVEGVLYAVGGRSNSTGSVLNSVEKYDQMNDKWTVVKEMGTKRYGAGVAVMEGMLYAMGGSGPLSQWTTAVGALNSIERYDANKNQWSQVSASLKSKRDWLSVAFLPSVRGQLTLRELRDAGCSADELCEFRNRPSKDHLEKAGYSTAELESVHEPSTQPSAFWGQFVRGSLRGSTTAPSKKS